MRLNNKGFAISGILYSMLILVITLMFLVLGILAGRRTTLNKIGQTASSFIEERKAYTTVCTGLDASRTMLYAAAGKEEVVSLKNGYYLIQAWGASGAASGDTILDKKGGNGAYVSAIYYSPSDITIYLNIGSAGSTLINNLAYNGGAAGTGAQGYSGGGGATSVAIRSGRIGQQHNWANFILIAAGGGGGGTNGAGGAGGGLKEGGSGGGDGAGFGAKSVSGGIGGVDPHCPGLSGYWGNGGNANLDCANICSNPSAGCTAFSGVSGGGGGGYYGGGGAASTVDNNGGGGGGASFIHPDVHEYTLAVLNNSSAISSSYKSYIGVGIAGDSNMPKPVISDNSYIISSFSLQTGNKGHGYVRITPMTCD